MPKSRLRKGHSAKVAAYKKSVEDKKRSFDNQMRKLYESHQQEEMNKQMASGEVSHEQIEGLNLEDFNLDLNEVIYSGSTSEIETVHGVTSIDQLEK